MIRLFSSLILLGSALLHASDIESPERSEQMDEVTAFRIRSDFQIDLDENEGWAAGINQEASVSVDTPFRIRFEVEAAPHRGRRQYSLQYRWNDAPWTYVQAQEFPYPSSATPPTSIVGSDAFFNGEFAEDLIPVSSLPASPGAGVALAPTTPGWTPHAPTRSSAEWEFALVVRHWSDGPKVVSDGDQFSFRLVNQLGQILPGPNAQLTLHVPEYHLGGTFVETPARIGPWESSTGELYFIMEPTETDNLFMMVKSVDGGKSWFEVDAEHRPGADDLEGVGSFYDDHGIIHIVHQTSDTVFYHAFATSDHTSQPDRWITDSQVIDRPEEPPVQVADITMRPDGSLVAAYAAGRRIRLAVHEPEGGWKAPVAIQPDNLRDMTNPSLLCRPDGIVELITKSSDGSAWNQQLLPNNALTPAIPFAEGLGMREDEAMSILPPVYVSEEDRLVVIFRSSDAYLYKCEKVDNQKWSSPVRVSHHPVVTNAVDSDQTGADAIAFGNDIWICYIDENNRDLYLSKITSESPEPLIQRIVCDIDGSWVRGQLLKKQSDSPTYGIIYDAGSKGGSGYNKFLSIPE